MSSLNQEQDGDKNRGESPLQIRMGKAWKEILYGLATVLLLACARYSTADQITEFSKYKVSYHTYERTSCFGD